MSHSSDTQKNSAQVVRPLSPHLQIYRWQITMVMSILHRATGIALSFALLFLMWWLVALAAGPQAYDVFLQCATHPLGIFVGFGISFVLFVHTCTGISHIIKDTGRGYKIPQMYIGGYTVIACAVVLTVLFWAAIIL